MNTFAYLEAPELVVSVLDHNYDTKERKLTTPPAKRSMTVSERVIEAMSLADIPNALRCYVPVAGNEDDLEKHAMMSELSQSSSVTETGDKSPERKRFTFDSRFISDAIIGLSDGLTVPFALTAGLSALGDNKVVIYGGLAELTAGAISMGLGGYLGAKSEE